MAEIRSTMEMVLERAAKLEALAKDTLPEETLIQDGMRLGARFMREDDLDIRPDLDRPKGEKALLVKGALSVFLRHIQIPRSEDDIPAIDKAMRGVLQLGESTELVSLLGATKKILEQHDQHTKQIRGQLEEQFTQQIAMMQQQSGQGGSPSLAPEHHPKFVEEWQKVTTQLHEKYGEALQQHKGAIEQVLGLL